MNRLEGPYRVYVGLVPTGYLHPASISEYVRAGIKFCGLERRIERLRPSSKVLLRPDVTMADPTFARYAYTHPEVTRAAIAETLHLSPQAKIAVIEKSAENHPTFRMFQKAHGNSEAFRIRGYYELEQLFPGRVKITPMEESRQCVYQLSKGGVFSENHRHAVYEAGESLLENAVNNRYANEIVSTYEYYSADFTIYCPKLKTSVLSHGFSGAIKLGSRQRGAEHGIFNDHYVCDMLEVCNPDLIISDGIIIGAGGNDITQRGHELGVILISNNALAHDWVAAQILNLDATKIGHLKIAIERGWGPTSSNQIELGGAGPEGIKQLSEKTRYWDLGFTRVDEFSAKYEKENPATRFPLEIVCGQPYEVAGAHGALLNWLYVTYDFPSLRPRIAHWPKSSVCVGSIRSFPANYIVYALGDRAIDSLNQITSSSYRLLRIGSRRTIELAQLKDGRRHILIKLAGSPPSHREIMMTFAIGSLGRMTHGLLRLSQFFAGPIYSLLSKWRAARNAQDIPVVITSRMRQNDWWALRPARSLFDTRPTSPDAAARGADAVL